MTSTKIFPRRSHPDSQIRTPPSLWLADPTWGETGRGPPPPPIPIGPGSIDGSGIHQSPCVWDLPSPPRESFLWIRSFPFEPPFQPTLSSPFYRHVESGPLLRRDPTTAPYPRVRANYASSTEEEAPKGDPKTKWSPTDHPKSQKRAPKKAVGRQKAPGKAAG